MRVKYEILSYNVAAADSINSLSWSNTGLPGIHNGRPNNDKQGFTLHETFGPRESMTSKITWHTWGCPRGVMVKAMNCRIVVLEFVLQSRYYVQFRANTLGKGMNPLILPPAMGK